MKTFSISCHIAQIKSRQDRTFALTVNTTKEFPPEEGATLLSLMHTDGTMAFKLDRFSDAELENLPEVSPTHHVKTPSKRLRDVLFVLWGQADPNRVVDFESFYALSMERIIEAEKSKLDS